MSPAVGGGLRGQKIVAETFRFPFIVKMLRMEGFPPSAGSAYGMTSNPNVGVAFMRPEKAGLINQAPTEIISLDFLHF
jgi:hypothetical protein